MPTLKPRKRFGQHFMRDRLVLEQIIRTVAPKPEDAFLEIGPGRGALTERLIEHAGKINAVEIDRDLCQALEEKFGDKIELHCDDMLKFNPSRIRPGNGQSGNGQSSGIQPNGKLRIIGNLPYNISSPLLFHLFDDIRHIRDMHFMLQLEVAQRLTASPGDKAYSQLSVISACMVRTRLLFEVKPESFSPPPKVTSAFVRMTPRVRLNDEKERKKFDFIVRTAFAHRRKTLAKNLKGHISPEELSKLGIDPTARPESISTETFLNMLEYFNYG